MSVSPVRDFLPVPSRLFAAAIQVYHLPVPESALMFISAQSARARHDLLVEQGVYNIHIRGIHFAVAVYIHYQDVYGVALYMPAVPCCTKTRQDAVMPGRPVTADDQQTGFVSALLKLSPELLIIRNGGRMHVLQGITVAEKDDHEGSKDYPCQDT